MVPLLHSLLLAPSSYFKPNAHPSSSSKLSRAPQRSECPFYGSSLALAPDRRPSELGWISSPRVCFYHSYSIFTGVTLWGQYCRWAWDPNLTFIYLLTSLPVWWETDGLANVRVRAWQPARRFPLSAPYLVLALCPRLVRQHGMLVCLTLCN